jgi:Ring finger domain
MIINSYTAFRYECPKGETNNCAICMDVLKTGDMVKSLQCSHNFHSRCINNWLLVKLKCPLCKKEVTV